jgi:hypothetical protein
MDTTRLGHPRRVAPQNAVIDMSSDEEGDKTNSSGIINVTGGGRAAARAAAAALPVRPVARDIFTGQPLPPPAPANLSMHGAQVARERLASIKLPVLASASAITVDDDEDEASPPAPAGGFSSRVLPWGGRGGTRGRGGPPRGGPRMGGSRNFEGESAASHPSDLYDGGWGHGQGAAHGAGRSYRAPALLPAPHHGFGGGGYGFALSAAAAPPTTLQV